MPAVEKLLSLPRGAKRLIAIVFDVSTSLAAVFGAYYLRFDRWSFPHGNEWISFIMAGTIAPLCLLAFGLYTSIHRFASWGTYTRLLRGGLVFAALQIAFSFGFGLSGVPRSVSIIQPILFVSGALLWRFLIRFILDPGFYQTLRQERENTRVAIYGAGSAGRQLAAALAITRGTTVVGYFDDDPTLTGNVLNGIRVYPSDGLADRVAGLGADDLLIAIPSASRARRQAILEVARQSHVNVRLLPGIDELAAGKVTVSDLREPGIEELLGRDPIEPLPDLMTKPAHRKVVMVTGAGGSIGSELCRQLILQEPRELILVDVSEYNLYAIHHELDERLRRLGSHATQLHPILLSVQHGPAVEAMMGRFRPDTVFHAAAYKHVPIVESNVCEAVANNVLATDLCAQAALRVGVERFILVSTDKAVRPTNVMGASKRLAEEVLQSFDSGARRTKFAMVRFGNVMGSSGSVIPLFRAQIKSGGPVTITHREITRYFMTIPEASQLVIQAGAMAEGGEVFLLDMGNPVRIYDLAMRMIELSGLTVQSSENPNGDIAIEVIGLRQGEKLYEELLIGEDSKPTAHPRVFMAHEESLGRDRLQPLLDQLKQAVDSLDAEATIALLKEAVPGFDHRPNGESA